MKKLCFLLVMSFAVILSAGTYPVKPGEKVMFFGDSITHGGYYVAIFQLLLDSRGIAGTHVMNSGISGGSAASGLRRIQFDVIDRKPDRVFILFGMNDVGRHLYREATPSNLKRRGELQRIYAANQKKIIKLLKASGITPVLVTPSPYDQYRENDPGNLRCNEPGLSDIADSVRKLTAEEKLDLIELHSFMTDMLKKHPELRICGNDRVHPIPAGHLVMAALIAEQSGLSGPVAEVSVSADGKIQSRFAAVTNVQTFPGKISFRYAPERLAVQFPPQFDPAEKVYPFTEKFNREILKITGLASGNYTLTAGDKNLGTFTAVQLADGIDLAALDTPNRERAEKAMQTTHRIYTCNSQLRTLEQCRQRVINTDFLPASADPRDIKAVSEALYKWLDGRKTDRFYRTYKSQVESFIKNAPAEPEILDLLEKSHRLLKEQTRPVSYTITVEKSK